MREIDHVAVIGLGYIGLPTAAVLARSGVRVTGVDINFATVAAVNRGEVPFVEPDLSEAVAQTVSQGLLSASTEVPAADAYIVAVPTPFKADKSADLTFIENAGDAIAPLLTGGELIILESTSPPGTTEHLANHIFSRRPDLSREEVLFAHCPERVLPGRVMVELIENDRIVGGITEEAAQAAAELYRRFCKGKIMLTNATTAELAKLVENSYRDVNIAFANELSVIADHLGVDVWELIELANHHPRVNILQPGPGVGGHCIAVDPWFIVSAAPEQSVLIQKARAVNDAKPDWVIDQVQRAVEKTTNNKIAVLGLAFKANIDDLRESPAVGITQKLALELPDHMILAVEPHVTELPRNLTSLKNVQLVSPETALPEADVVALLVDHEQFRSIDTATLDSKTVIDTRGFWRAS